MIRSAVTVSLVPEARGGPFVFWDDLAIACRAAAELGFDGVEVFAPSATALEHALTASPPETHSLKLAAVGTGAGWVLHRLSLTSPDASERALAREFIRSIIDAGAAMKAPAIVGSTQGRWSADMPKETAMEHLREALEELGEHAGRYDVPLLFEPLNRYEANLVNTLADGVALLESLSTKNVRLLGDLFHMNIEEPDLAEAIRSTGKRLGHVHFADSNRRPVGCGHTAITPVAEALRAIDYDGYVSAECLPWPDPAAAADHTIRAFRTYFPGSTAKAR